jgi:23S rRNA (cytosine1962-C5)-methyltransferase
MNEVTPRALVQLISRAHTARANLFDPVHETALRLFNGFAEGCPDIAIDLYAETVLIHNYADPPETGQALIDAATNYLLEALPWLAAIILKSRSSPSIDDRRGRLIHGARAARSVTEHGIRYAIDLTMSRDASLFLDARHLRLWMKDHSQARSVLNTFAYTGSLGVAALAGGASRAIQVDRNRRALDLARESCSLNGFTIRSEDFLQADFFRIASKFRRADQRFGCVVIDPPFFSSTDGGLVDQLHQSARLINKVRPLVEPGGYLVTVNNALYVSGAAFMQTLESLCAGGYLEISELIPVPDDFTGYPETRLGLPITDPAPFNHSTKIAVLRSKP